MRSQDQSWRHFLQVLHRTAANGPLRIVQQTQGHRGVGAWRAILRIYDPCNLCHSRATCGLSNILPSHVPSATCGSPVFDWILPSVSMARWSVSSSARRMFYVSHETCAPPYCVTLPAFFWLSRLPGSASKLSVANSVEALVVRFWRRVF